MTDFRFNQYSSFEVLGFETKWTIYLIYRPPSSSMENNTWLAELVTSCPANSVLLGDFNCPGIDWSENTASDGKCNLILDACVERGLDQMVTFATHTKGNILDLVLTDRSDRILSVNSHGRLGKSDHEILTIELDAGRGPMQERVMTRNWRKADWDGMRTEIGRRDWSGEMEELNTEEAWHLFKGAMDRAVEKFVPLREYRTADRPPWLSAALLQEIRRKRRLWGKCKRCPTQENKEEYKRAEKTVQQKIRRAKQKVEQRLASEGEDCKKFYSYMKTKTSTRTGVGPLKDGGVTVSENASMAEVLNRYFSTVFQQEDERTVPKAKAFNTKPQCRGVTFRPSIVKKTIRELKSNSAPGPDGIRPGVLKELVEEVAAPLSHIFTKSMESGTVPADWKEANVTPIFKKGQKSSPANYRPVSLTSVPGKVMERIIKTSIMSHLKRNNLIRKSQHGFMPKKSCATNLLEFLEKVTKAVDEGRDVDVIYLDFAKAFDLVPKHRLLEKLKAHGFGGQVLKWIAEWLTGRKQRVAVNGKFSSWAWVTSGVPQGSILGPVLFAIFINDIDDDVADKILFILKFADDTKLGNIVEEEEGRKQLQSALDTLCEWAEKWAMRFNVGKCHVLHLGRTNPGTAYTMNGDLLEETEVEKDIGVLISRNLKPGKQCEKAARTASAVLTQVLRAFTYRDRTVLPRIYAQYIRPHLEFAVQAWAPWKRVDIDRLENVQKRMVRQVTGLQGTTYEERLEELGMDTLEKRRMDQDMIQAFKILKEVDDVDKTTWFTTMENRPQRTRAAVGGHNLEGQLSRLELRRNFFSQRVVDMWNALPNRTKSAKTVQEFKNLLRKNREQV